MLRSEKVAQNFATLTQNFLPLNVVSYCQNFKNSKAYRLVVSSLCSETVLKAILKYKDHPSIKAIERVPKSKNLFNFSNVEKKKIFQEIV